MQNNTVFTIHQSGDSQKFLEGINDLVNSVIEEAESYDVFVKSLETSAKYTSNRTSVKFTVDYFNTPDNVFGNKETAVNYVYNCLKNKIEDFEAGVQIGETTDPQQLADEVFSEATLKLESSLKQITVSSYLCDINANDSYVGLKFSVGYVRDEFLSGEYALNQAQLDSAVYKNITERDTSFIIHYLGNVSNIQVNPTLSYNRACSRSEYHENSIRSMSFSSSTFNKSRIIIYNLQYYASSGEEKIIDELTDQIITDIIKPGMSDFEKEKAIHDYIVLNVAYNSSSEFGSAYDALVNKKALCYGYTLLAQKLFDKAGIKSIIINSEEMKHTWNMVFIDSNWYHLDVTWDDPVPDVEGRVYYDFFNLTDRQMIMHDKKKHSWNAGEYPRSVQPFRDRPSNRNETNK